MVLDHLDNRLCMFGDRQLRWQINFGDGGPAVLAFLVRVLDA